jgi:hypothetical protein
MDHGVLPTATEPGRLRLPENGDLLVTFGGRIGDPKLGKWCMAGRNGLETQLVDVLVLFLSNG